jgi:hypothetical protein
VVAQLLQNKARLLEFLESRLGNRADAEDVLQQAFAVLVEKGQSLRRGQTKCVWRTSDDLAFTRHVRDALEIVKAAPGRVVLLGIEATSAEVDYGWIEPAAAPRGAAERAVLGVKRFGENRRAAGPRAFWRTAASPACSGAFCCSGPRFSRF